MIDRANPSESGGGPPDGDEATARTSITAKINHARRELLDLTTRNRLLSAPRHTKRAKTIEVVDEACDEVYRILVTDGRTMTFLPHSSEAEDSAADEESSEDIPGHMILAMPPDEDEGAELAARHTDRHLQTTLDSPLLQKRLLALHYDGRSALEEQPELNRSSQRSSGGGCDDGIEATALVSIWTRQAALARATAGRTA